MSWKALGKVMLTVAKVMIPKIQEVEDDIKDAKAGPRKKEAVIEAGLDILDIAEGLSGKKIASDPRVKDALGKVNDALVDAQKVIARVSTETD